MLNTTESASNFEEDLEEPSKPEFIPIACRPEWAGAGRSPAPELPEPVVAIAQDEDSADLMAFFWAGMQRGVRRVK
jgi:hypothetical protein